MFVTLSQRSSVTPLTSSSVTQFRRGCVHLTMTGRENKKESATISCNERIWNFYFCMEPVYLGNTGKCSCEVDTSFVCCYLLNYAWSVFEST